MSETLQRTSLSEREAQNLANVTKTPAQMGAITPRWLLRMLPWIDVEAGIYRVNRVRVVGSEFSRVETRIDGETAHLRPANLRTIPLFADLPDAALEDLADKFKSVQVPKGETIIEEGASGKEMFILSAGKVEIYRELPDGEEAILSVLEGGDYFGEVSLLEGTPRNASARARSQTLMLKLEEDDFEAFLDRHEEVREALEAAARERRGKAEVSIDLTTPAQDESSVSMTFVDYERNPLEITLSSIMTTLRVQTRVMDLYKQPYDQLREQARLVIEAMKERQEWELLNNDEFGLLNRVVPSMRVPTRGGPPTPDDMDELLSRVWKEPAFFLAHPEAIAAFGRECTNRGVPPPTVNYFGTSFITWRGVPLIPTDKLEVDRSKGAPTTRILLLRVGEERRGVVGLHQTNIGDERLPSFALRFNGIDQTGVANYLVSVYFSLAVLSDDAVGSLEGVQLGHFHEYD